MLLLLSAEKIMLMRLIKLKKQSMKTFDPFIPDYINLSSYKKMAVMKLQQNKKWFISKTFWIH